ncbi:MAG: family 16 glycosylhydrolase [Bacilli bacterium]|nr:family 16 glycosylhydrolase [Bacilli bacterium]
MRKSLKAAMLLTLPAAIILASCGKGQTSDIKADPLTIKKVAEFSGDYSKFFASSGYGNGEPFNVEWNANDAQVKDDGLLHLSIHKNAEGREYPYLGGEFRSKEFYGYGDFATRMKPSKTTGTASTFFLYTGEWDSETLHPSTGEGDTKNPGNAEGVHDEIDIEFLGKDTTKVQFNYFTSGKGEHEYLYDLGFDASLEYHTYGFRWEKEAITWFVDDKPVYRVTDNIPSHPGRIITNYWAGTEKAKNWMGEFKYENVGEATYQWHSATGEAKETHKVPVIPSSESSQEGEWDGKEPVDITVLNADAEYTTAVAEDKKSVEVTYDNVAPSSYKCVILDIPEDSRATSKVSLELENKGEAPVQIRVDVNAATTHGANNITAINTSASFNGAGVYTDVDWGGSKFDIAAGAKGTAIIDYEGSPVNLLFMIDSSIYQDGATKHEGDIVISNIKFGGEGVVPVESSESSQPVESSEGSEPVESSEGSEPVESSEGSEPVEPSEEQESFEFDLAAADEAYTVNVSEDKKSASVSYTAVQGQTYKNVTFNLPAKNEESGKVTLDLKNPGTDPVAVRIDVNAATTHGDNNITAINTKATFNDAEVYTDLSWGGSNTSIAGGVSGTFVIEYTGDAVTLQFMIDSFVYGDTAIHAGALELSNLFLE